MFPGETCVNLTSNEIRLDYNNNLIIIVFLMVFWFFFSDFFVLKVFLDGLFGDLYLKGEVLYACLFFFVITSLLGFGRVFWF